MRKPGFAGKFTGVIRFANLWFISEERESASKTAFS